MMSDENWIRELAKAHRERQAEEESQLGKHWDRLSSGELSAEEEAELLALAESSEEGREAYEAFRPLGPEFHASAVKAIREQAVREQEIREQAVQEDKAVQEQKEKAVQKLRFVPVLPGLPAEPAAHQKPQARLWPFSWRPQFAGWGAAAAALAASVWMMIPRPSAPLPKYEPPELSRAVSTMRGEEPEVGKVFVIAPGEQLKVLLRPKTRVQDAEQLEAQAFLSRGQDLRPLKVQGKAGPWGTFPIEVSISRDLPPGPWTFWAVVGRAGKLPDPATLRLLSAKVPIQQRDWVAMPKELQIQPKDLSP